MRSHKASREAKKANLQGRPVGSKRGRGGPGLAARGPKDEGLKTRPAVRAKSKVARQGAHPKRTPMAGPQADLGSALGRVGPGDGNPLLKAAGRFHGHIGPFLAIGMRMGLLANEEIGRDPFGVEAVVTVEARPPRSCLVDGVQYAAGCTLGKGNIRIRPHADRISARFRRGAKRITITLRENLLRRLERDLDGMPEEGIIDYAFEIMDTPAGDLFEVTR